VKGVADGRRSGPVPFPPLVEGQAVGLAGPQLVQLVVGLYPKVECPRHVLRGLQGARQCARVELVGVQLLLAQPLLQQLGLFPPAVGETRVAPHAADDRRDVGDGLAVADQVELGRLVSHRPPSTAHPVDP
jgi:hypothetical protein